MLADGVYYFADVLRPWIHARAGESKASREFIFRRDPRCISPLYFWDPDLETYFEIPYRDRSRPSISVWELREIKRKLKADGCKHVDEIRIFAALDEMRAIEAAAIEKTRKARRRKQQRADAVRRPSPTLKEAKAAAKPKQKPKAKQKNKPARVPRPFEDRGDVR